jgi:hypothetical protein
MMVEHVHSEPTPASQLRAGGIPEALDCLILELLAKQPEQRPQTAREVAGRLGEILAQIDEDGLPWVEAEPLPSRRVSLLRRWRTAGAVAGTVALVAVGLALLFGSNNVEPKAALAPAKRPAAAMEPATALPAEKPRAPEPTAAPSPAAAPSRAPAPVRRTKKSRARVHKRGTLDPFGQ